MSLNKNIMIGLAIMMMIMMLLFVVFGEKGLTDLHRLKTQKDNVSLKNEELTKENLSLYREIDRLKHDPGYVENVARKELGFVGKDEVIIKVKPKPSISNSERNVKK